MCLKQIKITTTGKSYSKVRNEDVHSTLFAAFQRIIEYALLATYYLLKVIKQVSGASWDTIILFPFYNIYLHLYMLIVKHLSNDFYKLTRIEMYSMKRSME